MGLQRLQPTSSQSQPNGATSRSASIVGVPSRRVATAAVAAEPDVGSILHSGDEDEEVENNNARALLNSKRKLQQQRRAEVLGGSDANSADLAAADLAQPQTERVAEPHIHAVNVVRMALDMLAVIKHTANTMAVAAPAAAAAVAAAAAATSGSTPNGLPSSSFAPAVAAAGTAAPPRRPTRISSIEMRIGVHTGDIIAGVIGTKQLRYDVWGHDCLIANQMESNGIPSGVVVSATAAALVEPQFELVPLAPVSTKRGPIGAFAVAYPKDEPWRRLRTVYDKAADTAEEKRREERHRLKTERRNKLKGAMIAVRAGQEFSPSHKTSAGRSYANAFSAAAAAAVASGVSVLASPSVIPDSHTRDVLGLRPSHARVPSASSSGSGLLNPQLPISSPAVSPALEGLLSAPASSASPAPSMTTAEPAMTLPGAHPHSIELYAPPTGTPAGALGGVPTPTPSSLGPQAWTTPSMALPPQPQAAAATAAAAGASVGLGVSVTTQFPSSAIATAVVASSSARQSLIVLHPGHQSGFTSLQRNSSVEESVSAKLLNGANSIPPSPSPFPNSSDNVVGSNAAPVLLSNDGSSQHLGSDSFSSKRPSGLFNPQLVSQAFADRPRSRSRNHPNNSADGAVVVPSSLSAHSSGASGRVRDGSIPSSRVATPLDAAAFLAPEEAVQRELLNQQQQQQQQLQVPSRPPSGSINNATASTLPTEQQQTLVTPLPRYVSSSRANSGGGNRTSNDSPSLLSAQAMPATIALFVPPAAASVVPSPPTNDSGDAATPLAVVAAPAAAVIAGTAVVKRSDSPARSPSPSRLLAQSQPQLKTLPNSPTAIAGRRASNGHNSTSPVRSVAASAVPASVAAPAAAAAIASRRSHPMRPGQAPPAAAAPKQAARSNAAIPASTPAS
jgi:hypothetical protein